MTTNPSRWGARLTTGVLAAGAAFSSVAAIHPVQAVGPPVVVYTVTQTADDVAGVPANCPGNGSSPNCSLRDAAAAAIAQTPPSSSTINLSQAGQYTLTHGAIAIAPTLPGTVGVTVNGFSKLASDTVIDGNNADRIFNVHLNTLATLTLNNLTLQHGNTATSGGALFNGATMNLSNVVVTQNTTAANGGGIENPGSLTIDQSTLTNNTAGSSGGAIDEPAGAGGSLILTRSTLSANVASNGAGGALSNFGGLTQLFNDTLFGNTAQGAAFPAGSGGGVFAGGAGVGQGSQGNTDLTYVTLSGNTARAGGGVFNDNVSGMALRNDILTANAPANCAGTQAVGSLGYNLQFGGSAPDSCQFAAQGKPGEVINQDPLLGPAANNGGVTLTMLPAASSPVVDKIPPASPLAQCPLGPPYPFTSDDQRLLARPQAAGCDIGAVEVLAAAVPVTPGPGLGAPGPSASPAASPVPAPPSTGAGSDPGPGWLVFLAVPLVLLCAAGAVRVTSRRRAEPGGG